MLRRRNNNDGASTLICPRSIRKRLRMPRAKHHRADLSDSEWRKRKNKTRFREQRQNMDAPPVIRKEMLGKKALTPVKEKTQFGLPSWTKRLFKREKKG